MADHSLLLPLFILIAWTLVIFVWMFATRIPAILKSKMEMDPNAPSGSQMAQLPANIRWKADNYNHLLEQPVLFYAATIALTVLETTSELALWCAWAYVILRMVHSLVQTTINNISLRFAVFMLSSLPLFGMAYVGISALL